MFALIDCNSFFASCERVFDPKLKNKPVVVLSNNDGCIVTRTREVKKLGIPMGAPYFKYKGLLAFHKVTVLSSNFSLYGDMSDRVMTVLSSFSPDIEYYSVDEAFLSLEGFSNYNFEEYGKQIKEMVYKWTGIPISVGIAPTKTLAKAANEYAKMHDETNGVQVLPKDTDHSEVLKAVPIDDVWGIGRRTVSKMKSFQVNTAQDLKNMSQKWMKQHRGVSGVRMHKELNGIPCYTLENRPEARKGITGSRSFGRKVVNENELQEAVAMYIARAAHKLRRQKSVTSMVTVYITTGRHAKQNHYANSKTIALKEATADTRELIKVAQQALKEIYKKGYRYKKAGVHLSALSSVNTMQRTLFDSNFYSKKKQTIMATMDAINNEWGTGTVTLAAEGIKQPWKVRKDFSSPRYTASWDELLTI